MLTTSFPSYKGDVKAPFIYALCKALTKQGAKIDVVSSADGKSKLEEEYDGISIHRFHYFFPHKLQRLTKDGGIPQNLKESFLAKLQFPLYSLKLFLRSMKYAKKSDIIHCQWSYSALIGVFLKKMYKKPLMMTERGSSANIALKNALMRKVLLYVLKHCDVITANNQHQLKDFLKLGVQREKLYHTPNGINMQLFKPKGKKESRAKLKLIKNKKILLYVGRLVKVKGPDYFLEAMKELVKKRKGVHCYIIGDGRWEKKLKEYVKLNNLRDVVTFLGAKPLQTIPDYINAADFLVLPSLAEGKPNAVGEAFACGVPVIASDIPGSREYFSFFPYGLLTPAKDAKKLAQTIEKAFMKNWKTKTFTTQHTKFRKKYTWEYSARECVKLYKKLLH
tara:strand:- start:18541 stop:19716 length:1176 start_codon:yes stop_codon:yes gene_type:complete